MQTSALIDELVGLGSTYCSITLLDKQGKAYLTKSSNEQWQQNYIDSGLYTKCHLMQEALRQLKQHTKGFIFLWDNYFPINDESVYLEQKRKEQNIAHGVAYCLPNTQEGKVIITVAGKSSDVHFTQNTLRHTNLIYKALLKHLLLKRL